MGINRRDFEKEVNEHYDAISTHRKAIDKLYDGLKTEMDERIVGLAEAFELDTYLESRLLDDCKDNQVIFRLQKNNLSYHVDIPNCCIYKEEEDDYDNNALYEAKQEINDFVYTIGDVVKEYYEYFGDDSFFGFKKGKFVVFESWKS